MLRRLVSASIRPRFTSLQTQSSSRFISTSQFRLADETKPAGSVGVLTLQFVTPSETLVDRKPAYMVNVPAVTGTMGILADHWPTIVQMKPGLVTVYGKDVNDVTHRYFVSGGFTVVRADSTAAVTAVEAFPLDELDVAQARKGLDEATAFLGRATTEKEKAEAQIGIEVNEAIIQAIEQK